MTSRYTFRKAERLCSRKTIEALFAGGNKSFSAYPIRAVYMSVPQEQDKDESQAEMESVAAGKKPVQVEKESALSVNPGVQLLISVSKRHFKHAVDRNRVKRQLREAYRLNKHLLLDTLPPNQSLALAFLWLSSDHIPTKVVEEKVRKVLQKIAENVGDKR